MPQPSPAILSRRLITQSPGGLICVDATAWPAGPGHALRACFATGTIPAAFDPAPAPNCAVITELRDVSGGLLLAAYQSTPAPIRLALAGAAPVEITVAAAETGLFTGLNAAVLIRMDEPAETVRDWLHHHHRHHGLQGAVIVNRARNSPLADELRRVMAGDAAPLTLVVLDCPVALGQPGTGPLSHPYLAPDAPGKDRMEPPAPDPWRAPLGEMVVLEAVKWRFLAQARAVLCLDVPDIIPPRPGLPTVFDLAVQAKQGVVLLNGQRIYPWRIRPGKRPTFGDHICRPFDALTGVTRWCVAPEISGLDSTWRTGRIAYAKPLQAQAVGFYRCMGIRHPGHATSDLVPKTSLIEDPALLALSQDIFAHTPLRAPKSVPHGAPQGTGRTAIVTTMKNEGPFILEWLAYHRVIGVDDFLIYTNDCTDGTDVMLDLLQARGLVQHRDNPFRQTGLKPQHAALQAAEDEPVIRNAAWAICMDVDEFINIKIGDGTLPALYAAIGDANMVSLTWRLFGNADIPTYQDRLILDQFTTCAPELTRKPHQAWGFKTLFRNIGIYKKLGVHRPKGLKPDLWNQIHWLNGSGKRMPREMLRNGWRSTTTTYGYDMVSLNHYAVRSAESFLVKRDRGRVNHVDRDQGLNYWFRMNFNAETDRSIQRLLPALRAEYDRLLSDPAIHAAHASAVAAHRAKIQDLRTTPDALTFYNELTSPRMQALCRLQAHFGAAVFAAGPGAIPIDLLERPLPADFFFTLDAPGHAKP